jgi:hypothetical protein
MPENVTATAPAKFCIIFWDGQKWRWIPHGWDFGVSEPEEHLDDAICFAHRHGYKVIGIRGTTPGNVKKSW